MPKLTLQLFTEVIDASKLIKRLLSVIICSYCLTGQAEYQANEPLAVSNRLPSSLIVNNTAALGRSSLASGWSASLSLHSHFIAQIDEQEQLVFDGETTLLELHYRWPLLTNWQADIQLPLVYHGGGFLDGSIEGWHELTGLPDGDRPKRPRDQLLYQYMRKGELQFSLFGNAKGLGDLQLSASRSYGLHEQWQWTNRLKLPTGQASRFTGNGSWLLASELSVQLQGLAEPRNSLGASASRWSQQLVLGLAWQTEPDLLPEQAARTLAYGRYHLSWQQSARISLHAQLDIHSPYYSNSALKAFDYPPVLGSLGLRVRSKTYLIDVLFIEDLWAETASDIGLQISIKPR